MVWAFSAIDYSGINLASVIDAAHTGTQLVSVFDAHYITLLRLAFIPLSVFPSLAMMIGYLQGPRYRAKKLKDIEAGSRKKRKKLKVNKKTKTRVVRPEV